jgi:hypothetical protein
MLTVVAGALLGNTGCMLNMYSSDPVARMHEMLNVSENERVIQEEVERIMFIDQPSHLNPQRIHGGIQ